MHVLDTDVMIEILRNTPKGVRFARRYQNDFALTAINVFELVRGSLKSGSEANAIKTGQLLAGQTVLPFDEASARKTAQLYTELEKQGKPIDFRDAAIAGTCIVHDAALATLNSKHFYRISGLKIETPQ